MKTLDEVIAEMEGMEFIGTLGDALYYLKEYRKHLIQDLDELRQKKYELEINMKLNALLQEKPWEKRE